jgi:hypothetical protein
MVKIWAKDRLELFDLTQDVGEENDLSVTMPEKTHELHQQMVNFLTEVDAETRKTGSKAEVSARANPKK